MAKYFTRVEVRFPMKKPLKLAASKYIIGKDGAQGCLELHIQRQKSLRPKSQPVSSVATDYLAEYQFWAHFASTDKSTLSIFLPSKGLDIHSTTMAFATSAVSVGPSKITSSWTCFPVNIHYFFNETQVYWGRMGEIKYGAKTWNQMKYELKINLNLASISHIR